MEIIESYRRDNEEPPDSTNAVETKKIERLEDDVHDRIMVCRSPSTTILTFLTRVPYHPMKKFSAAPQFPVGGLLFIGRAGVRGPTLSFSPLIAL